ncbi:MAG: hypothetical protein A3D10_04180 [Omnitrophica WOR_2 bacterium RIFCSPHIGHO2_02_FULL_48_11]|nr:MAG: hypothetical protein A3D10_04180 [Omnitrophica WOR_2 bacterium RIFCSPHIGHO2_02_FULL_48_11]
MSISTTKKVLIIDDEEGVRESLKLILSDHYDLAVAENGELGLEILKNAKDVGVVLMDIKMPKKSGLDILKVMHAKYPPLKIIIVTGYKSVETAQEAVRLGASGYIVKPFKSEEILSTVGKYIKEAK